MNKNISSLLSEADNSLMKSRLYQAFDLYVQAGSLALDEPELLLEVGVKFGKLGHQCYYHGNYQLAIDAYWIALMFIPEQFEDDQRVIEEYLEHPSILYMIGKCHIELKQWEEAIYTLEKVKEIRLPWGQEAFFFKTLGDLYFSLKRYEEGIEVYEECLEHQKKNRWIDDFDVFIAIDNITNAYDEQGKQSEALAFLQQAFEESYELGIERKDISAQYLDYAKSISVDEYKKALMNLIDFHEGEYAEDPLTADEKPDEYCLDAFARLGNIYVNEKNFSEAEKYLDVVLNWKDDDAFVLRSLASLHIKRGEISEAEGFLKKAKNIEPESLSNWELDAELLLKTGKFAEAKEAAERGIKLIKKKKKEYPDDPNYLNRILESLLLRKIDALVKLDQYEEATDELGKAQKQFPKTEIFYTYSAVLLYLSDRPNEAQAIIDAAEKEGVVISERMKEIKNRVTSIIE